MKTPIRAPKYAVPVCTALLSALLAAPSVLVAQGVGPGPLGPSSAGPVVEGYGPVYDIPSPDLATPTDRDYRVAFDVSASGEPGTVNPYLATAARFLNMHARAGVPVERLHVAVVLHGEAAKDALLDGPFRERYGVENANLGLLRALADAGVELYMCGQSAMARGLPRDELAGPIRIALSAMTAHAVLQERGYRSLN